MRTPDVIEAFKKIKREDFVLPEDKEVAQINAPLPIGYGQTISQPMTVAFMLELLQLKKGDKVLDVGSGSGWTASLLGEIVGENGRVYGIEIVKELKKFGEKNVAKHADILHGRVKIFQADGYNGLPEVAPFDKILVSAAAESMPGRLLEQLKIGGRLVIPLGRQFETQDIVAIDRVGENEFKEKRYPGFIFVPLIKS